MKVVVIGNGKIGSSLTSALVSEGHDVTVIDSKERNLRKIKNTLDVMCVEGNGATWEVQKDAGVAKADIVVAVTPYDELNILCCLIAKKLGADKTILRVRMPDYFTQMHHIREQLGLSMIINPELATANDILRVIIFPSAAKVEVFDKGRLELIEYKISYNSIFNFSSLKDIYKKIKTKFLICAVQRDDDVYIPSGDFVLKAGDRIHVAATHKNMERFFRISHGMKEKIKSVMIVGGGSVCFYLASQLLNMGMHVKIIEKDPERSVEIAHLLPKAIVVCGDGTDQELLLEEGLENSDAFVALTGIDEENIIISLFVQDNTDVKVIAKITRDNYINLASVIGLDTVVSPKNVTSSNVLNYVRSLKNAEETEIESLYRLVGNKVEAIEFKVKENLKSIVGKPLKELRLKKNILICAIIRKREIIIPDGDSTIELGDSVVIVSKDHRFSELKDILL